MPDSAHRAQVRTDRRDERAVHVGGFRDGRQPGRWYEGDVTPSLRPQSARTVTLEHVAQVAGVSRATVSRVVNGVSTVDQALRETVERAIAATGYVPNRAARSLVTGRTGCIALVLPDEQQVFSDPFFGRVITGAREIVRQRGMHLVLMLAEYANAPDELMEYLREGHVDGVILVYTHSTDPLPRLLTDARIPVVLSARPFRPVSITYVDVNQQVGARLAADHLIARGCQRIATISGPLSSPAGVDRLAGFREAMAAHGRPDVVSVEGNFTRQSGATAMEELLASLPDVDGVFVASDLMAQGALPVLHRHGRRIPEDVAVIGFDDSAAATACDPPLTTIRQPVEHMAAEMARLLLERIERADRPITSAIFEPSLVIRESA